MIVQGPPNPYMLSPSIQLHVPKVLASPSPTSLVCIWCLSIFKANTPSQTSHDLSLTPWTSLPPLWLPCKLYIPASFNKLFWPLVSLILHCPQDKAFGWHPQACVVWPSHPLFHYTSHSPSSAPLYMLPSPPETHFPKSSLYLMHFRS